MEHFFAYSLVHSSTIAGMKLRNALTVLIAFAMMLKVFSVLSGVFKLFELFERREGLKASKKKDNVRLAFLSIRINTYMILSSVSYL